MTAEELAEIAATIRRDYSPEALDPGVSEPTVVESGGGSALVLPGDQQPEPLRSMRLIDAAAVGTTLVITFTWADGTDDDTVYLMPLDCRDEQLDLGAHWAVSYFLLRFIEHSLGGPRDAWADRTTVMSDRLRVVRPWRAAWEADPAG
ncbi:hypothetical protein [Pseudonocardia humida]|uniref:SUKH-4 immunity protein of toxin-antitoxin system n=1 Tax=Pseudonocardia humida TaxID=2800819 RepID=A0ABT0ZYK6_9PSEU|nr:hypothetical protein [Pseudonocardia humida]MCO1655773.1 hypothetical protein [Pseudonocardia humida]